MFCCFFLDIELVQHVQRLFCSSLCVCASELMRRPGECAWKIRWNVVKATFNLKATPFICFACLRLSKGCFSSPFIFACCLTCESISWNFTEVFQALLNRINDITTPGSHYFWRGGKRKINTCFGLDFYIFKGLTYRFFRPLQRSVMKFLIWCVSHIIVYLLLWFPKSLTALKELV